MAFRGHKVAFNHCLLNRLKYRVIFNTFPHRTSVEGFLFSFSVRGSKGKEWDGCIPERNGKGEGGGSRPPLGSQQALILSYWVLRSGSRMWSGLRQRKDVPPPWRWRAHSRRQRSLRSCIPGGSRPSITLKQSSYRVRYTPANPLSWHHRNTLTTH